MLQASLDSPHIFFLNCLQSCFMVAGDFSLLKKIILILPLEINNYGDRDLSTPP